MGGYCCLCSFPRSVIAYHSAVEYNFQMMGATLLIFTFILFCWQSVCTLPSVHVVKYLNYIRSSRSGNNFKALFSFCILQIMSKYRACRTILITLFKYSQQHIFILIFIIFKDHISRKWFSKLDQTDFSWFAELWETFQALKAFGIA